MMHEISKTTYNSLLGEVRERIRSSQYEALRAVNKNLISLYWDIGRIITTQQEGDTWGKSVVEQLSKDLQLEFPGVRGFSVRNIWNMRNFFLTYEGNEKLQPLVAEIGWTHNLAILTKCKDEFEREFYLRSARKHGWSKNVLLHQIENQTYEKTLLNQTNFDTTLPEAINTQAKLAVKDEYTFDFLKLGDLHSEYQLEKALLGKIDAFLRQLGGMFSFVGSQYRLEVGEREFFIDLLFYHRSIQALVAVDLKVGRFEPEHVGKMQFYLSALNAQVKLEHENPSLGLLLCKSKDETVVEYALNDSSKPIGVATYKMVNQLPREYQGQLPDPDSIALLLEEI